MSTIYQQALIALRESNPGKAPLDINNQLCSVSGRKQAVMVLEGEEENEDLQSKLKEYEIFGYFKVGEKVDGFETMVINPEVCKNAVIEFYADRLALSYGVSYQGLGFSFTDSIQVTSSSDGSYIGYTITSKPDWVLTATPGATSGVINTLNLVIDRNRTHDDDRTGNILLSQNESNETITISITQKGRLTEGIPTEYPYVTQDKVVDRDNLNVVQVGEQIWTQDNYYSKNVIAQLPTQEQMDDWCIKNNVTYRINVEDYNKVFKSGYTKVTKNKLLERIQNYYNDSDYNDKKYQIATYKDFLEFIGYIVAREGATSDQQFYKTTGKTLAKKILDITKNGYDDIRISYPLDWRNNIGAGTGLTDSLLKTGTDDYALSYMTLGSVHSNQEEFLEGIYPFNHSPLMMQEDDGTWGPDFVSIMTYSLYKNPANIGWGKTINDKSAYHPKPIRLIKYRELPYEVYHKTEGDLFLKINQGDPIPEGYEIEPKGLRRGIYLGNPNLTGDQVGLLMYWINNSNKGLSYYNNQIG